MLVQLVLFPDLPLLDYALTRACLEAVDLGDAGALLTVETLSATAAPVSAADGTLLIPGHADLARIPSADLTILLAGPHRTAPLPMGLRAALRGAAEAGGVLGGIGDGAALLARLGHLAGRCAVLPPDLDPAEIGGALPTGASHVLDRDRLTSRGGLAAVEALTTWIARAVGPAFAAQGRAALGALAVRPDAPDAAPAHPDPVIAGMDGLMAAHLAHPLPLDSVAGALGLSAKQLRHRCQAVLGEPPLQRYLALRLSRAQHLVENTGMNVPQIATATGFASPSAFTRSYRARFGTTPRESRARRQP